MFKNASLIALSLFALSAYAEPSDGDAKPLFKDYPYTSFSGVSYVERQIDAADVGLGVISMHLLKLENDLYQYDYGRQSEDVKKYNSLMCEKLNSLPPSKDRVMVVGKDTVPFSCDPIEKTEKRAQGLSKKDVTTLSSYQCMAELSLDHPGAAQVRENFAFSMEFLVQLPGFGEYDFNGGIGGTNCFFSASGIGGEGFEDWGVFNALCMSSRVGMLTSNASATVTSSNGGCFNYANGSILIVP